MKVSRLLDGLIIGGEYYCIRFIDLWTGVLVQWFCYMQQKNSICTHHPCTGYVIGEKPGMDRRDRWMSGQKTGQDET